MPDTDASTIVSLLTDLELFPPSDVPLNPPSPSPELMRRIDNVINIIQRWRSSKRESELWSGLREEACAPSSLLPLVDLLLRDPDTLHTKGVTLYLALLASESGPSLWNPILFSPVLSALVSASRQDAPRSSLILGSQLLMPIASIFRPPFASMAGQEICLALAELATIFASTVESAGEGGIELLRSLAKTYPDEILPFIATALLNTTSNSANLSRTKLVALSRERTEEERFLLGRHILMRTPERAQARRNAAWAFARIVEGCDNLKVSKFITSMATTSKPAFRAISALVCTEILLLMDESGSGARIHRKQAHSSDNVRKNAQRLISVLIRLAKDKAPQVRSNALDCLSRIAQETPLYLQASLNEIVDVIMYRSEDSSLAVRRSSLALAESIVQFFSYPTNSIQRRKEDENEGDEAKGRKRTNRECLDIIVRAIDGRLRDRSPSLRAKAVRILTSLVKDLPDEDSVASAWLEGILPLSIDSERAVQDAALEAIGEVLLDPEGRGNIMNHLKNHHLSFMPAVFSSFKNRSIPLNRAATSISRACSMNIERGELWGLAEAMSRVNPVLFHKTDFTSLFPDRLSLSPDYLRVLYNLKSQSDEYTKHLPSDVRSRSDDVSRVEASISLLSIQPKGSDEILRLSKEHMEIIESAVFSEDASSETLYTIFPSVVIVAACSIDQYGKDLPIGSLHILMSETLPNGTIIPSRVRAAAVVALGRIALGRKEEARALIGSLARVLTGNDAAAKCNALVALGDLTVRFPALVDPHVSSVTNCLQDESPAVRYQSIHVLTRLISDDYLKMRSPLFLALLKASVDNSASVSSFAKHCLFNVITAREPGVISNYFVDALLAFSGRGGKEITLLSEKVPEGSIFRLIGEILNKVIGSYVSEERDVITDAALLKDSISSLCSLEERIIQASDITTSGEGEEAEKVLEEGSRVLTAVHLKMMSNAIAPLGKLARMLRDKHSPLQKDLRGLFRIICGRHIEILRDLENAEPLIAAEVKEELAIVEEPEVKERPKPSGFQSPLLSRIASTPKELLLTPSSHQSVNSTPIGKGATQGFSTPRGKEDLD